jgi:hypothetical protein
VGENEEKRNFGKIKKLKNLENFLLNLNLEKNLENLAWDQGEIQGEIKKLGHFLKIVENKENMQKKMNKMYQSTFENLLDSKIDVTTLAEIRRLQILMNETKDEDGSQSLVFGTRKRSDNFKKLVLCASKKVATINDIDSLAMISYNLLADEANCAHFGAAKMQPGKSVLLVFFKHKK